METTKNDQQFGSIDLLGIADGVNWDVANSSNSFSEDENIGRTKAGEFNNASHATFNSRKEISIVYEAQKVGSLAMPEIKIGGEMNGFHVTAVSLSGTNTGLLQMTVTCHKHDASINGHIENERTVPWPSAIQGHGCINPFGGLSGLDDEDIQSYSFSATVEHVDKQTKEGEHLVGRSQGFTIEGSITACTNVSPNLTLPEPWLRTTGSQNTQNTDFFGMTISGKYYPATSL